MRPIPRLLSSASAVLASVALLAACTTTQPYPKEHAACYERVQQHAAQLMPVFAALGYRLEPDVRLDEEMLNNRGFRAPDDVLGDAIPNGRIRLRPSRVCVSQAIARAVLAHEMAHVALQHRGVRGTGVTLAWEKPPQQEIEADGLALKVLRQAGGHPGAVAYVACRLGSCAKPVVGGASAIRSEPPQPRR